MGIGVKIHSQLALVESGFFMGVLIFNRIFQGDDMHRFVFVDFIEDGRQGGGFTGPGGTGDKNDPVDFLGNLEHGFGKFALIDSGNFGFQFPQDDRDVGTLGKYVHAEAGFARQEPAVSSAFVRRRSWLMRFMAMTSV